LREGLAATAKVMFLALVLDINYQNIELPRFHPGQAVIVAVALGFIQVLPDPRASR
jgi:hypothetical protein